MNGQIGNRTNVYTTVGEDTGMSREKMLLSGNIL